jgi:hypothetical protein
MTAGILPMPDPLVTFAAYPAFGLAREDALAVCREIADGMAVVRDALEACEVSRIDREVLAASWAKVFSPPSSPALPSSRLVCPSRSPGEDAAGRLAELGVAFDPATHEARKTGRSITIRARSMDKSTTLAALRPGSGTLGPRLRKNCSAAPAWRVRPGPGPQQDGHPRSGP